MRINVVIPSYNYGNFLKDSVYSVIKQKYSEIRVIIVDDGSKDNTKEVCEELAKKDNCIIYIHQQNSGVSMAGNTGIEYVLKNRNGFEYIAFLDADDLWRKDFLNQEDEIRKILDDNPSLSKISETLPPVTKEYRTGLTQ